MINSAQIFKNLSEKEIFTPDKSALDTFDINNINDSFVISRDLDGNILSRYKDNIWNFEAYISDLSQHPIFYFKKRIEKNQIQNVKKLMLLLMIYGNGRDSSQYSVGTLKHYFTSLFRPLSLFATQNMISIDKCLSDKKLLMRYIEQECTNRQRVSLVISLLSFLHKKDNSQTKINYQQNNEIIQKLHKLQSIFFKKLHQTEIIPIRILSESLSQRWEQIKKIEQNINAIQGFLKQFIYCEYFASSRYKTKKSLSFNEATNKYKLNEVFQEFNVLNRTSFLNFISNIQGTCIHLIHAYTGMRRGEVLNLHSTCIQKVSNDSGVCYLVSKTSKLEGRSTVAKWVTCKETETLVNLLNILNVTTQKKDNKDHESLPLFISFLAILRDKQFTKIVPRKKVEKSLPLNNCKLRITSEDKKEIEYIDYKENMKDIIIGEVWNFKSHQYRRSLAIYSIQSGLVSLGALQKQLKHIFREMTLYYANGASLARKIFDLPKEHIAKDFDKLKPELDALAYIKEVLFSDEKIYGTHGKLVNKNYHKQDLNIFLADNRDKTIEKFKRGEMAYKETALGACISLEACESSLSRSFTSCLECDSSILKKSKLEESIVQQKSFLNLLNKDSIEYRTELKELKSLENIYKKKMKE